MPARLVALNGTSDIVLSGPLTVAGRHASCDTRIDSSRVSRRHCCLALDSGEILVRDLGSTNGTWINGRRVQQGVLRPGDTLGIAHLKFQLVPPHLGKDGPSCGSPPGPGADPATAAPGTSMETAYHDVEMPRGGTSRPGSAGEG